MSEQPQRSDIPHLQDWANAMAFVASHYRQSYSPGTLHAAAEWATQKRCLMRLNIYAVMPDCIANFLMAMTGKCRPGGCRLWYSSKMARLALLKASIYITQSGSVLSKSLHY